MVIRSDLFLPGVCEHAVVSALSQADGREIESGKLLSPESSAALAANTFGWFLERPDELPCFPGLELLDWPACRIDIERQLRFPWKGGRHPWLDAIIETECHVIGVESKRFEPFRDGAGGAFSSAYDRDVWGNGMAPYEAMRDALRSGDILFTHLDAVQLVKHAFGLITESYRIGKAPILLYLFAEPGFRAGLPISPDDHKRHRTEIATFSKAVTGAEVRFVSCCYRDWLGRWREEAGAHAAALIERFQP